LDRNINVNRKLVKEYDVVYIPLGSAAFGGAERSLLDLCEGVRNQGASVLILAEETLRNTPFNSLARERQLKIKWIHFSPEHHFWQNLLEAINVFCGLKTSIIHFNISWRKNMWLIPLVARMFTRSRLIGTMRAMPDPHQSVPRRRYFGIIPGLQLWHFSEVFIGWIWARLLHLTVSVNSQDYPKRLKRHYGFSPEKIQVIYNAINIKQETMAESQKQRIRDMLKCRETDVLLGYIGRLSSPKGIEYLIRSMLLLPNNFRLLIIGDGLQKSELELLVKLLKIQKRVQFLDFIECVDDYVAVLDIVVVPSVWYEAFGRVVIEAMNQGVPVVASRIGGMAEIFTHGIEGFYFEPKDVAGLANVLEILGNDRECIRKMGVAGRKLVQSRYSIDKMIVAYALVYNELTMYEFIRKGVGELQKNNEIFS